MKADGLFHYGVTVKAIEKLWFLGVVESRVGPDG